MAKPTIADEVQVLRFFEAGSIEKAEVMFNIVSEKMRERLQGTNRDCDRNRAIRLATEAQCSGEPKSAGSGILRAEPGSMTGSPY
jgi:hypothetical protein